MGLDNEGTARRLGRVLRERGLTIACAESLTAGNIQAALSSVSGSSAYFLGGVTAYTEDQKVRLLGVDRELCRQTNCVDSGVASQMAMGARELFGSRIAVATTGYIEPDPSRGVETPFAWYGIDAEEIGWASHLSVAPVDLPVDMSRPERQRWLAEFVLQRVLTLLGAGSST